MFRNTFIFISIIVLLFLSKLSTSQTYDWVQTIRPGGNEHCWDIASDFNGNVFVTGRVKSTSTFGSGSFIQTPPYKSCCETDVFVAKYRPNGDLAWVSRDGGVQPDWGRAITTDRSGNVFVTGDYSDTSTFGANQIIASGPLANRNIFLAKYDSLGTCLWAKTDAAIVHSKGYGVTTDSVGNSYITGYVGGASNIDGIPFGVAGKNFPFVAKFSPSGVCLWIKNITVQYNGAGNGIKMGKDGNLVVVGEYKGTLTINSVSYPGTSASWADVFIIKMDTAGNFLWVRTAIGAFQDQANSVDFDSNNDIYIAGTFANDLTFGGTTTVNSLGWASTAAIANSRADGFLAKYTANGTFLWVKTMGNSVDGLLNDLTLSTINITRSNKVLVCGSAWGDVDLVGIPLSLDTVYEAGLLTAFDTAGNLLWYKTTGGVDGSHFNVRSVTSDSSNNIFVGGGFTGISTMSYVMNFDSIATASLNGFDGLIARLTPPLAPLIVADSFIVCPGQDINFSVLQDGSPLSYQWTFIGGTPSASLASSQIVNYPTAGTFQVQLIIGNGHQIDTVMLNVLVTTTACLTTNISEVSGKVNVLIYPNPASHIATINIEGVDIQDNTSFQLFNYMGQEVGAPVMIKDNIFSISVENLPSGGYFFNVFQNNSVIKTEKLLILNR